MSLVLACASAEASAASTVHDFDSPGTPYAVFHADYGSNAAQPTVTPGGPSGSFLRLAMMPAVNLNTIAFDRTDAAVSQITADFDFRMIPPPAGRNQSADGFGFALLKTAVQGTTGPVPSTVPEAAVFAGSLGVGFRTFNTNSITIAFDGSQLLAVDVTPVVDLASGQFIHARIVMRPGNGFSDVTVVLTPPGGSPTTVIDRYPVPGFTPYVGRAWFGARSGGLAAHHDLDNIDVQFTGSFVPPNLPFVELLKAPGIRFVSYSPTNFDPRRDSSGNLLEIPSAESITQDLTALRPGFNGLILYGTQVDLIPGGQPLVPWIVSEARRLGFRAVMLGVWDPKDNAEVDAAAALITQHGAGPSTFAVAVCVGNEGILRGQYGIADLDSARARLEAQLGSLQVPIVTSEDLARYTAVPQLKAWGTFLFPILVPHWNVPALGPADAAAWVRQEGAALAGQAQLTVLVKEPGWPSGGLPRYTPETQRQFFAAYQAGPQTVDSAQFPGVFTAFNTVLEAFDAYWKESPDFTTWGLLGSDRTPKPAYSVFVGATVYRLRHPAIGAYLFTVYAFERDSAQLQYGYLFEGNCCNWYVDNAADGRLPLFRLFSSNAGEYFFTISSPERDSAVQQYGYVYEGVAAYCHPASTLAAPVPWYRLRLGNKHLYTIYESERDSAVNVFGYTYEGISCYLPPP